MERVQNSNPLRASSGNRNERLTKLAYSIGVAGIVSGLLAAPSFAQDAGTNAAAQMISTLTSGVTGLLIAGVAVVVAIALFYWGKSFIGRLRS